MRILLFLIKDNANDYFNCDYFWYIYIDIQNVHDKGL